MVIDVSTGAVGVEDGNVRKRFRRRYSILPSKVSSRTVDYSLEHCLGNAGSLGIQVCVRQYGLTPVSRTARMLKYSGVARLPCAILPVNNRQTCHCNRNATTVRQGVNILDILDRC